MPTSAVQWMGSVTATYTLALPYCVNVDDVFSQSGIRVVCFFYACKLLDLALVKAEESPVLLTRLVSAGKSETIIKVEAPMETWHDIATYIWLLLTEMRYHSFNIAVEQKKRPAVKDQPRDIVQPLAVMIFFTSSAVCTGITAFKVLTVLVTIQTVFEAIHALLHPRCSYPLFYRTLTASSMGSFWTTHWHACAASFLQSLGYQPGRKFVGRWFGVLAAFNISGLWHAWASMPLVEDEFMVLFGLQIWGLFMVMGLCCLAERWIWGEKQEGVVQRVVVWSVAVLAARKCFGTLERAAKPEWLKMVAL